MGMRRADRSNPWLLSIEAARRRAPAWVIAALGGSAAAIVIVLAGAATGRLRMLFAWAGASSPGLIGVTAYLLVFGPLLAIALIGGRVEGRPVVLQETRPALALAGGAWAGFVGFGLAAALAALAGAVGRGSAASGLLVPLTMGVSMVTLQATAEEVYFRGWIQPNLCARWGVWLGLAATSLIFAAVHLTGAAGNAWALANLFLAGLCFGLLALRSGGVLAPAGAHAAWNWLESCGLGLAPNPGVGPFGAIVDLDLKGPPLWGGGEDGLNASLPVTLVLLAALALLAALGPLRDQPAAARA
jgi:membrane protease YdiL (CAAX protease family)